MACLYRLKSTFYHKGVIKMEASVSRLLALDRRVRYVGVVDNVGSLLVSRFKVGVTSLLSQDELKEFAKEVAYRRRMRERWDPQLGKVLSTVLSREKMTVVTLYVGDKTVLMTLERGAPLGIVDAAIQVVGESIS